MTDDVTILNKAEKRRGTGKLKDELIIRKDGTICQMPDNNVWTEEIGAQCVILTGRGKTHKKICKAVGISEKVLTSWLNPHNKSAYKKEFAEAFRQAYKDGADYVFDDALDIVDDDSGDLYKDKGKGGQVTKRPNSASVQRSRLRYDCRIRYAGIRNKDKFGKVDTLKHEGNPDQPIIVTNFGDKPKETVIIGKDRISKEN